jgi:hypothetical protein
MGAVAGAAGVGGASAATEGRMAIAAQTRAKEVPKRERERVIVSNLL